MTVKSAGVAWFVQEGLLPATVLEPATVREPAMVLEPATVLE